MVIREMSREECLRMLAGARLARLGSAHENQPYIVPVYIAYQETSTGQACLYGFTTLGQKVAWMRANPLVCVEVDEVTAFDQWVSVIATGRYEELPNIPGSASDPGRAPERSERQADAAMPADSGDGHDGDSERNRAWQILSTHLMWQEPGSAAWAARSHLHLDDPLVLIFYRILINAVTGHKATREAEHAMTPAEPAPVLRSDEVRPIVPPGLLHR